MKAGSGPWLRRAVPYWAVGLTGWYVWSLHGWCSPRVLAWALPWFPADAKPHPALFAAAAARFVMALAAVTAAGAGVGTAVAGWLRWRRGPLGRDLAAGWSALGGGLLGLGLVGVWSLPVLAAVSVAAILWGAAVAVRRRGWRNGLAPLWRFPEFAFPAVAIGWIGLLVCLAPETFQDAMRYHLFLPRQFLLVHKFVFVERYFFWSYLGPQHMLNVAALALDGDAAAKAVNVAMGLGTILAALRIARLAGLAGRDLALALGLTVAAPGLLLITASPFGEHGVWLPILLAVEALIGAEGGRRARLREGAVLVGLAFSAKSTALFGFAGLAAMLALPEDRVAWKRGLARSAAPLAACVAVPAAGWAVLRWLWTGDPVSPQLARLGAGTLDASSRVELTAYYRFVDDMRRNWLASPDRLLRFPLNFMGAHGGFWEHPGPAIPVLALPAALAFTLLPAVVRRLTTFAAASLGCWVILFGGVSPHYVMAAAGVWTVGLLGVLPSMAPRPRAVVRACLEVSVFVAALLSVSAGLYRFGPRDVVFGVISRDAYLTASLEPRGCHYPLRRDLDRVAPGRGTVYVLGDDTSYYLGGRVFTDYENGSDPLLWRIAQESDGPARIRVRLRQRKFTHMIYSTRWPDILAEAKDERMRFAPSVAARLAAFWAAYAQPVAWRETDAPGGVQGSYAFALLRTPRAGAYDARFSRRWPFLPGAGIVTWAGDRALAAGDLAKAAQAYGRWAAAYGDLPILQDRLARVADRGRRKAEAVRCRRTALGAGWLLGDGSRR